MPPDHYVTVGAEGRGEFKDRGSKFLAYARPVRTEAEFQAFLGEIKKAHPKANHHCYAYRLGVDGQQYRANDDGEPSGTAGRPILGRIDSFELANVGLIVVRYFGGAKLGASGLIQAYKAAAAAALEQAPREQRTICRQYQFTFEYHWMSPVMNALKTTEEAEILEQDFANRGQITIALPRQNAENRLYDLLARIAEVHPEQLIANLPLPGLTVEDVGVVF